MRGAVGGKDSDIGVSSGTESINSIGQFKTGKLHGINNRIGIGGELHHASQAILASVGASIGPNGPGHEGNPAVCGSADPILTQPLMLLASTLHVNLTSSSFFFFSSDDGGGLVAPQSLAIQAAPGMLFRQI